MPRFAINCSMLFTEAPFLQRFGLARAAGFTAVESWWPRRISPEQFASAVEAAGVQLVLLNLDGGEIEAGERGYLNDPHGERFVRANMDVALRLATRLHCPLLHVLVGNQRRNEAREAQLERVYTRLKWLAPLAEQAGIGLTIEAMNPVDAPDYLFSTTADIRAALHAVGAPNLSYQYDVYHLHQTEGHVVETLRANMDRIGHVQVADVPGRHEPGSGTIDFATVFRTIDALDYAGYVALEYQPTSGTTDSFSWLPEDRGGFVPVANLRLAPQQHT